MSNCRFLIPHNVNCVLLNNKIFLSGPKGHVPLNFLFDFKQQSNIVCFRPQLNTYESAYFKQAALGASLKYNTEITLKGIGFNVTKENNHLTLRLNYSHLVVIFIPEVISVEIRKKTIRISSSHFDLLKNFARKIRKYRFPSPYKESGIFYKNEHFIRKEGKKL